MSDYVRSMIYLLECGVNRLKWYEQTGESKYLEDSSIYLSAANVYMENINGPK